MDSLKEKVYKASNSVESTVYKNLPGWLYKDIMECGKEEVDRERVAQSVVDYLNKELGLPGVRVKVLNVNQPHTTNKQGKTTGKTLGVYERKSVGSKITRTIKIWNLTASRGQVVSIKSFFDTLVHEFMHHYDVTYLRLEDTYHTTGFYKRITELSNKIKEGKGGSSPNRVTSNSSRQKGTKSKGKTYNIEVDEAELLIIKESLQLLISMENGCKNSLLQYVKVHELEDRIRKMK